MPESQNIAEKIGNLDGKMDLVLQQQAEMRADVKEIVSNRIVPLEASVFTFKGYITILGLVYTAFVSFISGLIVYFIKK